MNSVKSVTGAQFCVIDALLRAIRVAIRQAPTAHTVRVVSRPASIGVRTSGNNLPSGTCNNSDTVRDEISGEIPDGVGSVREFVRVAEAKLGQLQIQKERICSRMQALRYLTKHARESHSRATRSRYPARPVPVSSDEVRGGISGSGSQQLTVAGRSKLRRACRIALMETDQYQSCTQIYQRIQKRESMSLDGYDNPLEALTRELHAMVASSEILCSQINGAMYWRWK